MGITIHWPVTKQLERLGQFSWLICLLQHSGRNGAIPTWTAWSLYPQWIVWITPALGVLKGSTAIYLINDPHNLARVFNDLIQLIHLRLSFRQLLHRWCMDEEKSNEYYFDFFMILGNHWCNNRCHNVRCFRDDTMTQWLSLQCHLALSQWHWTTTDDATVHVTNTSTFLHARLKCWMNVHT